MGRFEERVHMMKRSEMLLFLFIFCVGACQASQTSDEKIEEGAMVDQVLARPVVPAAGAAQASGGKISRFFATGLARVRKAVTPKPVEYKILGRQALLERCALLPANRSFVEQKAMPCKNFYNSQCEPNHHLSCALYASCKKAKRASARIKNDAAHEFERMRTIAQNILAARLEDSQLWYGDVSDFSKGQFVQKYQVPAGTHIFMFGDQHGSVSYLETVLQCLRDQNFLEGDSFHVTNSAMRFIFHGDVADRGGYGVEAWYLMWRLMQDNPEHVFFIRGNHESLHVTQVYGFVQELESKFGKKRGQEIAHSMVALYRRMPAALFLELTNEDRVQCCHGGVPAYITMDPETKMQVLTYAHNPLNFLQSGKSFEWLPYIDACTCRCVSAQEVKEVHDEEDGSNGYMWSDFSRYPSSIGKNLRQVGVEIGQEEMVAYCKEAGLAGCIRAHQHSCEEYDFIMSGLVELKGVYAHWLSATEYIALQALVKAAGDGLSGHYSTPARLTLVRTLSVAADTVYGRFTRGLNDNSWAVLVVGDSWDTSFVLPHWASDAKVMALLRQAKLDGFEDYFSNRI